MIKTVSPAHLKRGDIITLTLYLSNEGRVQVDHAIVRAVQTIEGGFLIQLQDQEGALCAGVAVTDEALVVHYIPDDDEEDNE